MKLFLYLFGMAGAGVLGYLAEPALRFRLTATPGSTAPGSAVQTLPDGALKIDLASLTPEQLPPRVLLNAPVKITDSTSGVEMIIPAGSRVTLVRIDGGTAVVSPGEGPFRGTIPVTDTDLLQQLATNPPAPVASPAPHSPTAGDSEEPAATPAPPPIPEPAPTPAPAPEPTPPPTPAPAPAPESAASPEPDPAPTPEPTPAPDTPPAAGSSDVVKIMQASIRGAEIKEFTFEQVLGWTAGPDEVVDEKNYQTGIAAYKAETIFGVKTIQAKALIEGGKVQRWIWPKSGMDIK